MLGGWVSSNYAAVACPDFPTCQASYWPHMDFRDAFVLWRGLGIDYEGGVLEHPARVAIHFTHRLGAIVAALILGFVAWKAVRTGQSRGVRVAGGALAVALVAQLLLGPIMVLKTLPLPLATAHNAVAALLLLAIVALLRFLFPPRGSIDRSAQPGNSRPGPRVQRRASADPYNAVHQSTPARKLLHGSAVDLARLLRTRQAEGRALIVFTAIVGMFLAVPGLPPWQAFVYGTIGIGLAASSAAAINHVLDRGFDEKMARTRNRPIPTGHVTTAPGARCMRPRSASARCWCSGCWSIR